MQKTVYHTFSGGVYFETFYKFMTEHENKFGVRQKFVIIDRTKPEYNSYNDTLIVDTFWKLFKLYFKINRSERVIIHNYSLLKQWILNLLFIYKVKLFSWDLWGADLYFYRLKNKSIRFKIFDILRKVSIRRFNAIVVPAKGDYDLAVKNYLAKGRCFCVQYPNYGLSSYIYNSSVQGDISILLGNSADKSNNHEEALEILSRFSNYNIRILTPLSYGGDEEYVNRIIRKGSILFREKFVPIIHSLPYNEYINLINSVSIMVCNHDRQQALGNIWVLLSKGAKVYIRSNVSTYRQMIDYGISVYKTDAIENISFEEFIYMSEDERKNNSLIVSEIFSETNIVNIWNSIFSYI